MAFNGGLREDEGSTVSPGISVLFGNLVLEVVPWGERGGGGRDVEQQVCGRRRLQELGRG